MTRTKSPSLILACLLALLPLYEAGYLASVDRTLATAFDRVLTPSTDVAGPLPRELALRRLVDKTNGLLESEGWTIEKDRLMEIARIADRAGLRYQLPPSLILSVIHTESHFRNKAISPAGAIGLMQVQLGTARYLAEAAGGSVPTTISLFDPETNIVLGAGYLRQLIDRFGDLTTALAAYHVGPTEIGRRLDEQEPFSDHYGREIRERELFFTTSALPVVLTASARS